MKKYLIILILTFGGWFYQHSIAQTSSQFETAGDAAFERKDYNAALQYYIEANKDDSKIDLNWKLAETARAYNSYSLATKYYQKVIDSKEHKNYPMADYWIALMKKYMGDYKEAKNLFQESLSNAKIKDEYIAQARKEIASCDWALKLLSTPKDIKIEHLGKNINTPYSEFGAVKVKDTLFFSSLRFENKNDERVPPRLVTKILSTADSTTARPIRKINNDNLHTASLAFSAKTQRIFYCQCEYTNVADEIRCDLYTRAKEGKDWGSAEKLPEAINMPGTSTTQPTVGLDEKGQEILYYVSNRPDGKGKFDIWYAYILSNNGFSSPVNLASLNTRGDEMTPYYHTASRTLYFSSDGHESLGGLDIFASAKKGGTFSAPQNVGAPLNSSYNDFYFNLMADGKEAYFSSNRVGSLFLDKKNETCCYDVYKAQMPNDFVKNIVKETPKKEKDKPKDLPKETPKDKPVVDNGTPSKSNTPNSNDGKVTTTTPINTPSTPTKNTTNSNTPTPEKGVTPNQTPNKTTPQTPTPKNSVVMEDFLPLPLFFDNDEPDKNTKSPTTNKTYEDAFLSYYARKVEYMEKCGKGMNPLQKMETETEMMKFFEGTIKPNFLKLQKFTPVLLAKLNKGEIIEIVVKGYASPLAKNDYNTFLGKRRVASLYNYWNTYENGVFKKYFDNGQLKITQVSYGEDTASKDVSDDQKNESASIYSLGAAKERRIEIIQVNMEK